MKLRQSLIDLLCLALVGVILITACDALLGKKRVRGIINNDAVGYTTAARTWVNTGKLVNHIIYPSTLSQHTTKSVLYMPGFYVCLAISYKLFGFGIAQSILVSQVGYIVAAWCAYLTALRFFDRRTALLGAVFFLVYPGDLYFAVSAMSEMSIVASAAVAFCAFVYVPRRWMPWIGPVLLLIPFLFRETGCFLAIPMAAVLLVAPKAEDIALKALLGRAGIFLGLSVVLLAGVYFSPLASGRPSLVKQDIFIDEKYGEEIYRDVVVADEIRPTAGQWIKRLAVRFGRNVKRLTYRLHHANREFMVIALWPLLYAVPLGLGWGIFRRDSVAIGGALLSLVTLAFVCMFYTVVGDRPLRVTLFAFPLIAILEARLWIALFSLIAPRLPRDYRWWPEAIGAASVAGMVLFFNFRGFNDMMSYDRDDDVRSLFAESLNHDDHTTLVGPHMIGIPYVFKHYPVTYAFAPANRRGLDLLCNKHNVTTFIFEADDAPNINGPKLTPGDIEAQGLRLYRRVEFLRRHYLVYRRPKSPGDEGSWNTEREEQFEVPLEYRSRF